MTLKQFENLSSICVGLGLTKPRSFILTPLGKVIAEQDIFFDNIATLWLIHYVIASEPKWVVWNRLVNQVFPENELISTEIAKPYFEDLRGSFSEQAVNKKLPKEILSVLDAYSEQKFSLFHLIEKVSTGKYARKKIKQIEPLPFLFCLIHFRDSVYPNSTALVIQDIISAENSPGKILFLEDYEVNNLLSNLHDLSLIRIETVGDLEQIRFNGDLSKESVLNRIYRIDG
ncbi:MAG: DUF4007 family protein [Candidatus Pacebacteria bacterium]|nr:DUF4007 family protein [Candidatus Paceibacterota bacterium]